MEVNTQQSATATSSNVKVEAKAAETMTSPEVEKNTTTVQKDTVTLSEESKKLNQDAEVSAYRGGGGVRRDQ